MIKLIETKRTDPRLLQRMQTHYSKPKGFVGRNICLAIEYRGLYYGHIVFGSCTLHLPGRKEIIGDIDKTKGVNNLFYNISLPDGVNKYPLRNFTTKVLLLAEEYIKCRWKEKYGDEVVWFETLVLPPRTGDLYLKAGYSVTGVTKGFTCKRMSSENDGNKDGWSGVRVWNTNKDQLEPKLIFIKLV